MEYVTHMLDSARGIYIPRDFIKIKADGWKGITPEDEVVLLDPKHDDYWDTWNGVLDHASFTDADGVVWTLHQDGDLWVVAIEKLNEDADALIQQQVEYETEHEDRAWDYMTADGLQYEYQHDQFAAALDNYIADDRSRIVQSAITVLTSDKDALEQFAFDLLEVAEAQTWHSEYWAYAGPEFCIMQRSVGEIEIQLPEEMQAAYNLLDTDDAGHGEYYNSGLVYTSGGTSWVAVVDYDTVKAMLLDAAAKLIDQMMERKIAAE